MDGVIFVAIDDDVVAVLKPLRQAASLTHGEVVFLGHVVSRIRIHDVRASWRAVGKGAGSWIRFQSKAAADGRRGIVTENVRDYRPLEIALAAAGGHHHRIIYPTNRQPPNRTGLWGIVPDTALRLYRRRSARDISRERT